ncbi:16S rRNA (guanine(966)-N(2))-methyltransferase RsmD [Paenibacillus physcomitrellae]|uniref:rRNA methyltransferase YlbH n=1 Tax=Paenibacillus physcomitrellae TaxID=1619311 RepID=A0ABQ1GAX1_9BACL|nr:16S rRNA (guanine(966)-N(2))-methyltransferase RsmD [Paenibacillus physcomitrellae]GGA40137.1 putative rRNA methyltransferase YlbH [Paenibacillus physcomitrellae]
MRVISGSARGRALKAVPGMGTRPTTDKVKEAIFSIIGPYFDGGNVLDLFAGTGGLGIEALSRGMDKGVFIDMDYKALETIKANLKQTGLTGQAEVYKNDAERALKALAKREMCFDLVFLDPPYRLKHGAELMLKLEELELVSEDAVVMLEYESSYEYPEVIGGFHLTRKAVYGETAVSIYRREPGQAEAEAEVQTTNGTSGQEETSSGEEIL